VGDTERHTCCVEAADRLALPLGREPVLGLPHPALGAGRRGGEDGAGRSGGVAVHASRKGLLLRQLLLLCLVGLVLICGAPGCTSCGLGESNVLGRQQEATCKGTFWLPNQLQMKQCVDLLGLWGGRGSWKHDAGYGNLRVVTIRCSSWARTWRERISRFDVNLR